MCYRLFCLVVFVIDYSSVSAEQRKLSPGKAASEASLPRQPGPPCPAGAALYSGSFQLTTTKHISI